MSRRTLREVLGARLPRREDDRGSLAMLLMVILVSTTLGGLMLAMILTQDGSTRFSTSRVHALNAAQSGIDVMLGQIRASSGNINQLPCVPKTAPITGYPNGKAGYPNGTGSVRYSVWVAYYVSNPTVSGGTAMQCSPGSGPSDSANDTPGYAVITSTGTGGSTASSTTQGRTLTTIYQVPIATSGTPVQVQLFSNSSPKFCMDAGSATPQSHTQITLQVCASPPPAQQVFAFQSNGTIQLVSSTTHPLCISNPSGKVHIWLETCPRVRIPFERWYYNTNDQLQNVPPSQHSIKQCIEASPSGLTASPSGLTLQACLTTVTNTQSWVLLSKAPLTTAEK